MSGFFTKLLEQDQIQKEQLLQAEGVLSRTQVFPNPNHHASASNHQADGATERRNDIPTKRQINGATERHSDETTLKRPTERAAFDLYKDQVQAIRRLRAERELDGARKISLSDIAREAFDLYLQQNVKRRS